MDIALSILQATYYGLVTLVLVTIAVFWLIPEPIKKGLGERRERKLLDRSKAGWFIRPEFRDGYRYFEGGRSAYIDGEMMSGDGLDHVIYRVKLKWKESGEGIPRDQEDLVYKRLAEYLNGRKIRWKFVEPSDDAYKRFQPVFNSEHWTIKAERTPERVAMLIDRFVSGEVGPFEWSEFLSIPATDPLIEEVREECASIRERFPANERGKYCSAEGITQLHEIASRLRSADCVRGNG